MPVDFHLSKLVVRGFRGVRDIEIDIPKGKPLYIVGGNNAGKTTILEAMALALGGGGFHQFDPGRYDFFHDKTGTPVTDFSVTLHFGTDDPKHLPAVQGVGDPTRVHAIEVRGTTDRNGRYSHQRVLLDSKGDHILLSDRTPLKAAAKAEFDGQSLGYRRTYARIDLIRDFVPDVWLLTPENLYRALYEWRTGPLQRLSRLLAKRFLDTKWEFEHGGKLRPMPDTLKSAHEFFRRAVEAFPFWQEDMKPKLQSTISQYVGAQARFALAPDVQDLENWLTQQLIVSFAADVGGATTPLQSMGDGWQSLIRLAALDVLSQYPDEMADKVLLLAEEPETHLHPHLRRKLRDVFERLAAQGWLVVAATHGPEFVSFAKPQVVAKLRRNGDDVSKGVFDTASASNAVKFQEKLDERGNHEMLFAQRVILCEGKDDCWALRSALAKIDPTLDLDARSVSVVDTGSVGNLPDYADIATGLGIPWCAISDEDRDAAGALNPNTDRIRQRVVGKRGPQDTSEIWPGNLEICVGTPGTQKATPEWQVTNLDPKPLADLRRDHPNLVTTSEAVRTWLLR